MKKWKVVARHKWVSNAKITESHNNSENLIRFTATIFGWRNWKIYEGKMGNSETAQKVMEKVIEIRNKIQAGDKKVFYESNNYIKEII